MKIVVINSQVHKNNTYKLTQLLIKKLNSLEEDISEIYINKIPNCCGCAKCIMEDESLCPHYNQISPIIKSIDEADVIILNSPTYCLNMSGQMKSFCDHLAYRWIVHRPVDMRSKIGVAISTTAGAGVSKTTKQIAQQMIWWSVGKVYQIPFAIHANSIEEVKEDRIKRLDKKIEKIANKINKRVGNSKPCLKARLYFKIMTIMHKKMPSIQLETDYWKSKGWIK